MTKILPLSGTYPLYGNKFDVLGSTYQIRERNKTTQHKPKLFIQRIKQTYEYITSLFPTSVPHHYKADYKGTNYLISLTATTITIRPLH